MTPHIDGVEAGWLICHLWRKIQKGARVQATTLRSILGPQEPPLWGHAEWRHQSGGLPSSAPEVFAHKSVCVWSWKLNGWIRTPFSSIPHCQVFNSSSLFSEVCTKHSPHPLRRTGDSMCLNLLFSFALTKCLRVLCVPASLYSLFPKHTLYFFIQMTLFLQLIPPAKHLSLCQNSAKYPGLGSNATHPLTPEVPPSPTSWKWRRNTSTLLPFYIINPLNTRTHKYLLNVMNLMFHSIWHT